MDPQKTGEAARKGSEKSPEAAKTAMIDPLINFPWASVFTPFPYTDYAKSSSQSNLIGAEVSNTQSEKSPPVKTGSSSQVVLPPEKKQPTPTDTGAELVNLGHINSVMQWLVHTVPLYEGISEMFRMSQQDDAHEFLVELWNRVTENHGEETVESDFIRRVFGGRVVSQFTCMTCGNFSRQPEDVLDVHIPVAKPDSLETGLRLLMETIVAGYECGWCNETSDAINIIKLDKAPLIAIYKMKRVDSACKKITKHVTFPLLLDLLPFSERHHVQLNYELYAIVVHEGETTKAGHYYSFIRISPNQWFKYDDAVVSPINEEEVLTQQAYILFYAKQGSAWFADVLQAEKAPEGSTSSAAPEEAPVSSPEDNLQGAKPEMVNLGYINSVMQWLVHTVPLYEGISEIFRTGQQDDAQEFIVELWNRVTENHGEETVESDFIRRAFGGRVVSQFTCMTCGNVSRHPEDVLDMHMPVAKPGSLEMGLRLLMETIVIGYRCAWCNEISHAINIKKLDQAPLIATYKMKRFDSKRNKITKHVTFPLLLDLLPFAERHHAQLNYELYAIVVHKGETAEAGHYYSFIRISPNQWFKFEDAVVSPINEEEVLTQQAYILFYAKQGSAWFADVVQAEKAPQDSTSSAASQPSVSAPKDYLLAQSSEPARDGGASLIRGEEGSRSEGYISFFPDLNSCYQDMSFGPFGGGKDTDEGTNSSATDQNVSLGGPLKVDEMAENASLETTDACSEKGNEDESLKTADEVEEVSK